jgi:hypothetical protein
VGVRVLDGGKVGREKEKENVREREKERKRE